MLRAKLGSRAKLSASLAGIVGIAMMFLLWSGCGGSSSNNMSQAQALAVTEQFSNALDNALQNAFFSPTYAASGVHRSLATVVSEMRPDTSSPCTPTSTGENCSWPISYTGPCPGGGTISVAGDVTGSLNNTGGGSVQTQIAITPASCSVSNMVINGDPSVAVDSQINFTQTAPAFPIILTEVGGISYGPHPSGSCTVNVTYTISSQTTCTISGTACGQSVNGSCAGN